LPLGEVGHSCSCFSVCCQFAGSLLAVCWQWEASASLSGRACLCGNTSETCSVGSGQLLLLCDSAILLLCSVECRQYSCTTASSLTSRRLSCQVREH
jgi:hypothetical protein